MEMTQRALAVKANMFFEFQKHCYDDADKTPLFHLSVLDPLGCQWYNGFDIVQATYAAMKRLDYLLSVTRQQTIKSEISKNEIFDSYFTNDNNEDEFIDIVKTYAERFYEIFNPGKDVKRFLGNASMRPNVEFNSTRCMRGMPSFRKDHVVFVSQRNIDKQFISIDNFVPCYMSDGQLYYCGDKKPSVDTPIQIRLYKALPNINYMIHSHCYIENAITTSKPIPCGAIEEVDEVLELIDKIYQNRELDFYAINLKGHGSIMFASSPDKMKNVHYVGRKMPENMSRGKQ
jgi:ribulose-5-phosphate 4-epimerase/fuculose-1-phosphate aldolase